MWMAAIVVFVEGIFLLGAPLPARAEGNEALQFFEEEAIVVTASKRSEGINEAPGVVTVITKDEIKAYGAVNLADVLDRAPSIQMMSSHLWVEAKPVIRGNLFTHADNQTLILINGRPFRDAFETNSNFMIYRAFPVEMIERIEIIRGPGSVLYGSNAMAGVINIITREPADKHEVTVSGGGGSFGGKLGSVTAYVPGGDWNLSLGTNYFGDDGWKFGATTNSPIPGLGVITDEKRYGESDSNVSAFFDYKKRLTAQVVYSGVAYDKLGTLPVWPLTGHVNGKRALVGLGYVQPLSGSWELKANWDLNWYDLINTPQDPLRNREMVLEAAASGQLGGKTNVIVGGLWEKRDNLSPIDPVNVNYSEDHYSGYAQVDHKPLESLKLIAGAQYNRDASHHSALVPRAGAIYDVTDSVAVKLLYGQAFRTATPLEEFLNIPGVLIGNPDLAPERVTTYDAQLFIKTTHSQFILTFFENQYKDLIDRVFIPGGSGAEEFQNTAHRNIRGIELEDDTRLSQTFSFKGSATVQDEKDDVIFIPDYMVKAGIAYQKGNLTWGLFHSLFGKPRENSPLGGLGLNPSAKPINLLSFNINYKFQFMLPMALTVYGSNLLGDSMNYTEFARMWVNTLPIGPGRAVYGKLSVTF
jgi:outer membrane receptor for ferrienterochelin and colicins